MPSKFKKAFIFMLQTGEDRIAPMACSQGHFYRVLTGGMGPPRGKLLSNRGQRAAGLSSLLAQGESPTFKDRANIPHKMLEAQGNADENEKN